MGLMVPPRENIISSGGLRKSSIPKQSLFGVIANYSAEKDQVTPLPNGHSNLPICVFTNFRCMTCF